MFGGGFSGGPGWGGPGFGGPGFGGPGFGGGQGWGGHGGITTPLLRPKFFVVNVLTAEEESGAAVFCRVAVIGCPRFSELDFIFNRRLAMRCRSATGLRLMQFAASVGAD